MKLRSVLAGAALAVTAAVAAHAETWKLAVTDVEGMERLQLEWGPFKDALEAATGDTFEFYAVNSRTAAAEALRGETVDFVVSGPAEYVVINKLTNATPIIRSGSPRLSLCHRCARRQWHQHCGRPQGQEGGLW